MFSRLGAALQSFFKPLTDPVAAAREQEEAFLSQAVDLPHLEELQRVWDRRHQSSWRTVA